MEVKTDKKWDELREKVEEEKGHQEKAVCDTELSINARTRRLYWLDALKWLDGLMDEIESQEDEGD